MFTDTKMLSGAAVTPDTEDHSIACTHGLTAQMHRQTGALHTQAQSAGRATEGSQTWH